MLPMFDHKKIVSVIAARKGKPDVEINTEVEAPGSDMDPGLKAAAEDMLRAFESRSVMDMAKALKAAYECCEASPADDQEQEPNQGEA